MHNVVSRLTTAGVDRLQECRSANCGLMHQVDGQIACVGMSGGKCGWATKWAACLNGEIPFPNGAENCPHWLPVVPPCERGPEQTDDGAAAERCA
jgi:hypothetical protein